MRVGAAGSAVPPPERSAEDYGTDGGDPAHGGGRKARVLVVDDHPLNRRILLGMLRGWGCRAEGAASGEEALAKAARAAAAE